MKFIELIKQGSSLPITINVSHIIYIRSVDATTTEIFIPGSSFVVVKTYENLSQELLGLK